MVWIHIITVCAIITVFAIVTLTLSPVLPWRHSCKSFEQGSVVALCALSRVLGIGWVASHRQVEIDMDYVWMPMLVSRNIMYNVNQQQAKVFALKSYQPLMGQLVLMQLKVG